MAAADSAHDYGHRIVVALVAFAGVAEQDPSTKITWLLCRGAVGSMFGGGGADQLPAWGALWLRVRAAVESGHIEVVTGFRTEQVVHDYARLVMVSAKRSASVRCGRDGGARRVPTRPVVALGAAPGPGRHEELPVSVTTWPVH